MQPGKDKAGEEDTTPLVTDALAGWCAWADMLEAYLSVLGARATGSQEDTGTPGPDGGPAAGFPQNRALLGFMSQACLVFAASGARYWTRAAQIYAEYSPAIYRMLAASSSRSVSDPEDQRILLDRIRALLRELAELPGQESQWMQAELAKLEGQMLSGASRQEGDYVRRAKYKQS